MPISTITRLLLLILLMMLLGISSGVGCSQKTSDRDLQPVSPAEAINLASKGEGGVFSRNLKAAWVDPRSPKLFDEAHIPDSINIYFGTGEFEDMAIRELKGRGPIIVYGTDYQDVLSNAASKRLIELKIGDVYTLRGGLLQWAKDGNTVAGRDPGSVGK
jgi:rhodanese-related sulfurtransferase